MLSFHNDAKIKTKYLDRVKAHREADELIKGVGWENGKGCAVGCALHSYDHKRFPAELGLPEWIAHLEDAIFENLPNALAITWPERLLDAIIVGVDVEPVRWRLAIWRHTKQLDRLEENDAPYAVECRKALRLVIDCCQAKLSGENPLWSAAASAAYSAWSARSAAWSAAWSAEARSAESAAYSAWSAVEAAAYSAWSAAASAASARSARSAAWSAASAAYSAWSEAASAASAASARSAAASAASAAYSARSAASAASAAAWSSAEEAWKEERSAYFVEESEQLLRLLSECK